MLCNRAQPAVRCSAFGISCKNPECLWVRFSLPGFSPPTHKGSKQSIRPVLCQLQCDIFTVFSHASQEDSTGHHNVLTVPICTKHTHTLMHKSLHMHTQAGKYLHVPVLTHTVAFCPSVHCGSVPRPLTVLASYSAVTAGSPVYRTWNFAAIQFMFKRNKNQLYSDLYSCETH